MVVRAKVFIVSDRVYAGEREDKSGALAVNALREAGFSCHQAEVIPDGAKAVEEALLGAVSSGIDLLICCGGTGISPRDRTPEGVRKVIYQEIPGIGEEFRRRSFGQKPGVLLSRVIAGVREKTFIVALPGSVHAVETGMAIILPLIAHALEQIWGGDHG